MRGFGKEEQCYKGEKEEEDRVYDLHFHVRGVMKRVCVFIWMTGCCIVNEGK